MKKKLLCFILPCLLWMGCSDDKPDEFVPGTDYPAGALPVKEYESTAESTEPHTLTALYTYENGKLARRSMPYPSAEKNNKPDIGSYIEYGYDNSGKLISERTYYRVTDLSDAFSLSQAVTYSYDGQGLLKKEEYAYADTDVTGYSLFYYDKERLVKKERYVDGSEPYETYCYVYDETGNLSRVNNYHRGEAVSATDYFYTGSLIGKTLLYTIADGKYIPLLEDIYNYDKNGNLVMIHHEYLMPHGLADYSKRIWYVYE